LLGVKETDGSFTSEMTMLEKNQTYYVRSFALTANEEIYGEAISFFTKDIQLTTDSISYFQSRTATIHGSFSGINSSVELNKLGVVWSATNPNPILNGQQPDAFVELDVELGDGPFSGEIHGLQDSSFYFYRTFAILNFGNEIIYGETKTWETELNDVWRQKKTMMESAAGGRGFSIGGYGYFVANHKVFRYDPLNDNWEVRQQNNEMVLKDGAFFSIGTNIYLTCGKYNDVTIPASKTMYKYDTLNDEWSVMPDFPGTARKWVFSFQIGDVGYMGLGQTENGTNIIDFWKFEEGIGWTELEITNPDFPGTTHFVLLGGFSDGQRGYLAGDQNSANFWAYHPETNTWEEMEDLDSGVSSRMAGFHIDNELYLCTGSTEGQLRTKSIWRFNYEKKLWTKMSSLPGAARHSALAFAIGNKGYVGGGLTATSDGGKEFWEYKVPLD